MNNEFTKLLSISSDSLCNQPALISKELSAIAGEMVDELQLLLQSKNGFYAFEAALHVFPANCHSAMTDIDKWNQPNLWKIHYDGLVDGYLFFAEDIFGEQFGLRGNQVYRFDPETGNIKEVADSLTKWVVEILNDYEAETGYPLAHEWQELNGPLLLGQRLIPKIPFILGGDYSLDNLYAIDALKGMKSRSDIWRQLKDLPEGTEVKLKVI